MVASATASLRAGTGLTMQRKNVLLQLPERAKRGDPTLGEVPEREALDPIADIVEFESSDPDAFLREASNADGIIVSWGIDITREMIERLERCTVIGVSSVGVDMVDVEAATAHGIVVTNVPDIFIEEVADHTMMLLLACARRLNEMQTMAISDWLEAWASLSRVHRLWGRTLGLISFGNVARAVARRAQAFGMHVIACDPYTSELKMTAEGVEPVPLKGLLKRSDYVSMHPPFNEETERMMGAAEFRAMKRSAVLVNCGRGRTVDEPALIAALESGEIAAAGLDVLELEPPEPDNPLLAMENVIVTPHVASATSRMRPESRRRAGREVALVLRGRWPMSCVNPAVLPRAALERWQPYPMERGPSR